MFSLEQAKAAFKKELPNHEISDIFEYNNLFLIRTKHPDPLEENYDPFYSVDRQTGAILEFSVLTDGDPNEIAKAYLQQNR